MLFLLYNSSLEEICYKFLDSLLLFGVDLVWISDTIVLEVRVDKLLRAFFSKSLDIISVKFALVLVCDVNDRWEELYECQSQRSSLVGNHNVRCFHISSSASLQAMNAISHQI